MQRHPFYNWLSGDGILLCGILRPLRLWRRPGPLGQVLNTLKLGWFLTWPSIQRTQRFSQWVGQFTWVPQVLLSKVSPNLSLKLAFFKWCRISAGFALPLTSSARKLKRYCAAFPIERFQAAFLQWKVYYAKERAYHLYKLTISRW